MKIQFFDDDFTLCKIGSLAHCNPTSDLFFLAKTPEEISLACPTPDVPKNATHREDGWRAFRVVGVLDFGLIGILAGISRALADVGASIVALSTFDTDYVLVKADKVETAKQALQKIGYEVERYGKESS